MKKLNSLEIKEIELNILKHFDVFCKKNNLYYFLSGGTLLGAIRHRGFIPWDDDIDVCMPRNDYEKLKKIFPNILDNKYKLRTVENKNFDKPFIKMIDINTKVKSDVEIEEKNDSLWIDIFPVDGLPNEEIKLKFLYKKVKIYRMLLLINCFKKYNPNGFFKNLIKPLVVFIAKLFGKSYWRKKIERLALNYDYNKMDYVGAITWGLYGIGERMKKSEFEKVVYVDFEGYKFPTFSCWDSYLKGLYKNYMELPPIEKRKTHDMEAYYIGDDK